MAKLLLALAQMFCSLSRDIGDCDVVVGEHYIHGIMHGEVCQSMYHSWPGPDGQSMQWRESGYNDRI